MRVVMITHFPVDLVKPAGGVAVVSIALLRGLARFPDVELHVITDRVPRKESYAVEDPRCTVHPVPQPWWMPGFLAVSTVTRWRIAKILKTLKPDVVHTQGQACWVDPRRWPAVLTVHGIPEIDVLYSHRPLRRLRSWFMHLTQRRDRRRYRHIICISDYVRRRLAGQLRGRCHFIPNPVDDVFFDLARAPQPGRALFVGSIIPIKNVADLLEAARIVREGAPEFSLHLAGGPRRQDYLDGQRRRAEELGLADHVKFLGSLSRGELSRELAAAACLVSSSLQETFGIAIAEAMAAGVPVVASAVGAVPERVQDGENGFLVDPHRPDQIADRVLRILKDPALAERLGRQARRRAQAYRPERVADQTMEVYRQIRAEWRRT